MKNEQVIYNIRKAYEKNLTELYLTDYGLEKLPPEIRELKNLTILHLNFNYLVQFPPEIRGLKNLKVLHLSDNFLTELPPEIGELKNLRILKLNRNRLTKLPPEIGKLKNLTELHLSENQLTQLPPEIRELKNLTELYLSENQLTQIPPEIGDLKNLKKLHLYSNRFTQLPPEIGELKNLTELDLFGNQLTQISPEIGKLKNLKEINLSENQLTQLPPEIGELKNLIRIYITKNQMTKLPPEISELKNLLALSLYGNPLEFPPPEIVSIGLEAIFTYLIASKTTENNEAKLILVGNGEVGKTCLANRLVNGTFLEDKITEGINISKWKINAPGSEDSEIKLNIWDFGGQEIYHATHQFFLTKRSVYLLVWNARKTKDYDHIYYWLYTIEAFGEDSPIILVMSKMNESDDDLNLKDLKSKFPKIAGYVKIDSEDGKGISTLIENIRETAWSLPSMRVLWVDSWYKVREKLENLKEYWITYEGFCNICISEGLDDKNVSILDEYLHELGVTLHFKDRVGLKNIVILNPEWATDAFYKILSTKSVLHREGVLLHSELDQIWDKETYSPDIYPQLMELMNKFELSYELPEKNCYLIPELLPKNEPDDFEWDKEGNLCFYYCYDYFLPPGIIPRFIVRMHQNLGKKENGMPLCWREGAILELQNSCALVKVKPDEKQIEIRIKGDNKRGALGAVCDQIDQINASIKKINVSKKIPCCCSEECSQMYIYEDLLKIEKENSAKPIQCHKSFKNIPISLLLDGYKKKEEGTKKGIYIINQPQAYSKANSIAKAEQRTDIDMDVGINVNIDLKIDLPLIQTDFDNLKEEIEHLNSKLDEDLDKIQDSLDEVSTNSDQKELAKPFNKLRRFLNKLGDENSEYNKLVKGTQQSIEYAQKLGKTYNKFAQWLAMPQVPDLFLGK